MGNDRRLGSRNRGFTSLGRKTRASSGWGPHRGGSGSGGSLYVVPLSAYQRLLERKAIMDNSNGDVAIDFYHRHKEDIKFLKYMGMDASRFSIKIKNSKLSDGSLSGGINREGINFYNNVIDDLLTNVQGTQVVCSVLADAVLFEFVECGRDNSSTEPYLCVHHQLLVHATAAKLYRDKYQVFQKGLIGITLVSHWFVPCSNTKEDEDAVSHSLDFMFGWFIDPLTQGDYPFTMRALVEDRLSKFSTEQSQLVKSSFDFIGLNYYITYFAISISLLSRVDVSYHSDSHAYKLLQHKKTIMRWHVDLRNLTLKILKHV
ncbi:beta-glucosidase 13-like [Zingiber officinale]|uniref:beta-glucosidase 13-like n=1 Tax=Zingiber officinale TaxID=94328 RepID=UPI001C4C7033|nr:beta-glucosidase 13-like [Zingiber officinale]